MILIILVISYLSHIQTLRPRRYRFRSHSGSRSRCSRRHMTRGEQPGSCPCEGWKRGLSASTRALIRIADISNAPLSASNAIMLAHLVLAAICVASAQGITFDPAFSEQFVNLSFAGEGSAVVFLPIHSRTHIAPQRTATRSQS